MQQQIDILEIAKRPEWKQMLVDIVAREKLDPWDIDLAAVAKNYLTEIKRMKKLNLPLSANVILAASILLRYKSDSWILVEERAGEVFYIPDSPYAEPVFPDLKTSMRDTRRKVTLEELIAAVEDVINKEKKKARRKREIIIPDRLLQLIETREDFAKLIGRVYEKIKEKADLENLVLFSNLLEEKTVLCVINNFVPLLHLANNKKVAIWQEKIFGEIFIEVLNEAK